MAIMSSYYYQPLFIQAIMLHCFKISGMDLMGKQRVLVTAVSLVWSEDQRLLESGLYCLQRLEQKDKITVFSFPLVDLI